MKTTKTGVTISVKRPARKNIDLTSLKMEDATPGNGAPLEQVESAAKSGAESEELDSGDSEISSEEEDEVCSESNLHDVFLRQYNNTTNSDSGNNITPMGPKNCDKSQNIGNEKVTVMMNDAIHGATFNAGQISHRKILAESDGGCSESLKMPTCDERSTGKDQDTHGETGCVSDADGAILRHMKVENNDGVSKIPTVNWYEVGSNGAIAGSSGASRLSWDGVQAVGGTDGNEMLNRDDDAPNVGTGLLKIQVEDPLHGNKVKQEALDEEGSGSETDVETPNVPGERIGNINVNPEAGSSSHQSPFPLLQWLDQGARNHCNQKPSRAASSTAAAPSTGAGDICGGDSSQMIRFLSEKISSALSGVTEDFLNRGQEAITEKISDALFDVYGLMQGQPGPTAAGAPVFPDSKQVTVKKPAAKRRFPDSKPVTAAKRRSTQVQGKVASTTTSNKHLKADDKANEEVMDLTKSRHTRSAKKSYHCSKCDKAFSFSIQLKKHVCPFVDDDPVATATETSDDEDSDEETEIDESEAEAPPKVAKKTKAEKKIWKCDKCGDVFPWKKGLTKHMRTHRPMKAQPEVKSYKCHCGKLYSSKASLQTHKHLNHGEMPYKCEYCLAGFVKIQHLRTHEKTAHPEEKKYECETCKKRFSDRRNFRQHQRIHGKRKQYVCEVCGKAYSHIKSLRVHRAIHTEGKKFSCNICGKGFVYKCYLAIHERIHTGLKPYVCQVCGKGFKASGALGIHERIHSGDKPYKCPIESCGKEFSQQSNLVIHERTHTGEKPYKCDICLKSFARGGDLVKHKDTHVVDKPFKCDYCTKSFSRKQLLTEHVRGHTGDKPYICQVCGKGFARCQSVVEHERIHTGVKPFACELCGKAFTYSSHLTIHRRTHSGERPYKCRYCTRTFTNISNRIKHERTHTGEKPYECRNCGKRFNVKGDMVRHEQTHGPVNYQKDQEPADYSRNIARREKVPVPLYEERVVVESDKPRPSFVEVGDSGYNPNSYMFQQL